MVINTCMVREKAENRVYGLVHNLQKFKTQNEKLKIVVTGCMVGMAVREKTGKMLSLLAKKMPAVDEFLPIEEVGFDTAPIRTNRNHALVPITNGCNNFCTFCVVPFTAGREVSRPFDDIMLECHTLAEQGYQTRYSRWPKRQLVRRGSRISIIPGHRAGIQFWKYDGFGSSPE